MGDLLLEDLDDRLRDMENKIQPHPGQDKYPDLKTPIEEHIIGNNISGLEGSVAAHVAYGVVSFIQDDGDDVSVVTVSEWDLGSFIGVWMQARMDERYGKQEAALAQDVVDFYGDDDEDYSEPYGVYEPCEDSDCPCHDE